jgi:CHAT domain-containing protein
LLSHLKLGAIKAPRRNSEGIRLVSIRPTQPLLRPAFLFGLAFLLLPLTDIRPVDAQAEFEHTRQLFLHGFLAASQQKSDQGYKQFLFSQPNWASRFQLLEAESMEWRGMYEDTLGVLASYRTPAADPEEQIRELTIEAVALFRQQHADAAGQRLKQAEDRCGQAAFAACGEVLRARGVLAAERGKNIEAHESFVQSLNFARTHSDRWLEAAALLNIGVAEARQEHFDEAVDWSSSAYRAATALGAEDLAQVASGNLGWAYFRLGDTERALELFLDAEKRASDIGDLRSKLTWLKTAAYVYQDAGDITRAYQSDREALEISKQTGSRDDTLSSLEDLAHVAVEAGKLDEADAFIAEATPLAQESSNRLDELDLMLAQGKIAAARRQDHQAKDIFRAVETDPASQTSMRLGAEHELARLSESENDARSADNMYREALETFESARAELKEEESKLPFLTNATPIYDDYIHFLVGQGKSGEALALADQSRARTLAQGLGVPIGSGALASARLHFGQLAQKTGATLLFYWLGKQQSYLWAVTPKSTTVFSLPPQTQIAPMLERYRKAILGPVDPLDSANEDGRNLYNTLVAPASSLIRNNAPVVVITDGVLSQLNFETLLAPGPGPLRDAKAAKAAVHYWIEDVTLVSAPSLSMLAAATSSHIGERKLLLLGDAVSPGQDYPELPMASLEMRQIERHFAQHNATVFTRERANPGSYLKSRPSEFSYIHFVTHGVASRTDPLDSAIILSRAGAQEDSFKLHAREIIQHPIDAKLVTISACYGSGARSFAGEGLVGLSWAFLRAGAHNVIGALWEASDESTPLLMGDLYQGIEDGLEPGAALHRAKLALLHSSGKFRRPFYWGEFQIYAGR